jgi:RNA polymerase primary sigma factor
MDSLDLYKKEMSHEVLTREQEEEIGQKIEKCRAKIIELLSTVPGVASMIDDARDAAKDVDSELMQCGDIEFSEIDIISSKNIGYEAYNEIIALLKKRLKNAVLMNVGDWDVIGEDFFISPAELKQIIAQCELVDAELAEHEKFVISHNLRLVMSRAKNYFGKTCASPEDIIQQGNMGLIKAVHRFNWTMGNRFSTYAVWWIDMCIKQATHEQHGPIKTPLYQIDQIGQLSRAAAELRAELGMEPTIEEIAEKMCISVKRASGIRASAISSVSIDAPIGDDDGSCLMEIIRDPRQSNPLMGEIDCEVFIEELLSKINTDKREELRKRYGLRSFPQDIDELRKAFNFSRVLEIEANAIERLRALSHQV